MTLTEKLIDKEEFKNRRERIETELEGLRNKQNAIRQRDQEIENLKVKFDETMKSLESLDVSALTNSDLRKIIAQIEIYTNPHKISKGAKTKDAKQVNIQWQFLDETTEGAVFWEHMHVESEEWKRNVWYKGMTDEEIKEQQEWEQSLDEIREYEALKEV